jgi:ankyrin repeat protein
MGCVASKSPADRLEAAVRRGAHDAARGALGDGADANHRVKRVYSSGGSYSLSSNHSGSYSGEKTTETEEVPMLLEAAARGDAVMCEVLLDAGADVAATDLKTSSDPHATIEEATTALHLAARAGAADTVKLLLARGASATGFGYGVTPLMMAAQTGSAACVRLLLEAGADVGAEALRERFTAFHFVACGGLAPTVQPVSAIELAFAEQTATPVPKEHAECARLLAALGHPSAAVIDQRDQSGEALPALSYAAHHGDAGVAKALVEAGASKDVVGPAGLTPSQYARQAGHDALAGELAP